MKMRRILVQVAMLSMAAVLILGIAFFNTGCETEPADGLNVTITPDSITIMRNQSIVFTANGGFNYHWSLSDESLGLLSNREGPIVEYASRHDPGLSNMVLQVLTVTSTTGSATSISNNAPLFTYTAEAFINHLGDD